jgi:hypothetical protein
MSQFNTVLASVIQALDAEMLGTGDIAQKVVQSIKALIQETGVDFQSILQQFPPETQQQVLRYFS